MLILCDWRILFATLITFLKKFNEIIQI